MTEQSKQDVLMMAIFVVTREDVLTCARELDMPQEEVTEDVIELVGEEISQDLSDWRWVFNGMVKDVLNRHVKGNTEKVDSCPLGLVCSPDCAWLKVGHCVLREDVR